MNSPLPPPDLEDWRITPVSRPMRFADHRRAVAERASHERRTAGAALGLLALALLVGALAGHLGARLENTSNLAALRDSHLRELGVAR